MPQSTIFSVMSGCFLDLTSTEQRIKCIAQGHNKVHPIRLEPATPQPQVKHSTGFIQARLCPIQGVLKDFIQILLLF